MTPTWDDPDWPAIPPGRWRFWLRAAAVASWVFSCLVVFLLVRLVEAPMYGARRPWTPWITVAVCRVALRLAGLRYRRRGPTPGGPELMVANHAGWLDIFVLNAGGPLYFVAKSEVRGWPGIGLLARVTGTLFVARDPRQAAAQVALFGRRLALGHRLLFFPEGTSSDNRRVLPFKPTLFAAACALGPDTRVQPVTLRYSDPGGDARRFGWWGEMSFGRHLAATLSGPGAEVEVTYHAPLRVGDLKDRKALARAAEDRVRAGLAP